VPCVTNAAILKSRCERSEVTGPSDVDIHLEAVYVAAVSEQMARPR